MEHHERTADMWSDVSPGCSPIVGCINVLLLEKQLLPLKVASALVK